MLKQSLMTQKPKSDVAKTFVGVTQRDKKKRPKVLIVPGSKGKQYQVIVRRIQYESGFQKVTLECRLDAGFCGHTSCQGNHKSLCYHSRAAFDYCLSEAGFKGSWCSTYEAAIKLAQMGGSIMVVESHQSGERLWVVVKK